MRDAKSKMMTLRPEKELFCLGDRDPETLRNGMAVIASLRRRRRWARRDEGLLGTVAEAEQSTGRRLQSMHEASALAKNPKGTRKRRRAVSEAVMEVSQERAKQLRARKRAAQRQAEDALAPSKLVFGKGARKGWTILKRSTSA